LYKDIDLTSVKNFLESEFTKNHLPEVKLYKGICSNSHINDYLMSSTKQFERPSKTESKNGNSYNLLFNNLTNWSKLPLRKKSIIITNNLETAKAFAYKNALANNLNGKVFRVFPKSDAELVVCPKSDIWYSFTKGLGLIGLRGGGIDLVELNSTLAEIADSIEVQDFDDNWENFTSTISKIQNKNSKMAKQLSFRSQLVYDWIIKQPIDVLLKFDEIFDPFLNGFQVISFNDIKPFNDNSNNEIWTDSDTLLINVEKVNDII
jgi:hypothetical protein